MLWFISAALISAYLLVVFGAAWIICAREGKSNEEATRKVFGGSAAISRLVMIVLLLFFGAFSISLSLSAVMDPFVDISKKALTTESTTEIVSLKIGDEYSDQFCIGVDKEGKHTYYVYAVQTQEGLELHKVPSAYCLFETSDNAPHVEVCSSEYKHWFHRLITVSFLNYKHYVFYIPEDTTYQEYTLPG